MKKAIIRVDASVEIGTGHVMRCLTLAEELRESFEITFITANYIGHMANFIESKGFNVIKLNRVLKSHKLQGDLEHSHFLGVSQDEDAKEVCNILEAFNRIDLLIVDHYAIDYRWEYKFRNRVNKIFIIDDLADRNHECDILLDQNFYLNMEKRYTTLVNRDCKLLLGPQYALLREEFKDAKKKMKQRSGEVERIMIFFGGSDSTDETTKTLRAIEKLRRKNFFVDVVVGASNPNIKKIQAIVKKNPYMTYHYQVKNMAELMLSADLAIGAGGSTTWERCCLQLPTIVINIASNQIEISQSVEATGSIINLGNYYDTSEEDILNTIEKLIKSPEKLRKISNNCEKINDEKGTERVGWYLK